VLTDALGRFALPLAFRGPWEMHAEGGSDQASAHEAVTLPGAARTAEVVLTLGRPTWLAGRVFDAFGQPAAGASVLAERRSAGRRLRARGASVGSVTDEQGVFALDGLNDRQAWYLTAWSGASPWGRIEDQGPLMGPQGGLRLELRGGAPQR
jgi:hypothetical protein